MTDPSIVELATQVRVPKSGFGDLTLPRVTCLSATARVTEGTR